MNNTAIPKRIRIQSLQDVRTQMAQYDLHDLADFFMLYESKNQGTEISSLLARMEYHLLVMQESIEKGLQKPNITKSGLIAGGASHLQQWLRSGHYLLNPVFTEVLMNTLAVSELNACMGRIVASPTAGSAGVLPGALLTIAKHHHIPKERVVRSLFVAGGIGEIISMNASLSGASHGCQAENGSASAITTAAILFALEQDLDCIESGAAFALKNLLGLVCDPVAGLVEVPCVKRNVVASVNAIACAEMALSGIRSVIPFDEVVKAMDLIGKDMPSSLKETSLGGLAMCPSARKITQSSCPTKKDLMKE